MVWNRRVGIERAGERDGNAIGIELHAVGGVGLRAVEDRGDMRPASNQASAEKMASALASRPVGVAACAVTVDEESSSMATRVC